MKKFLSIFIALAMVLSLFAGVGARSAKAATTTFMVTPSGSFVGGADATGVVPVDAIGMVTVAGTTYTTVDVTTVGIANFGATPNVTVVRPVTATLPTSTDADWGTLGHQVITFSSLTNLMVGDVVTCGTAVGTILSFFASPDAYVDVTTAGTVGAVTVMRDNAVTAYSTDPGWQTLGPKNIAFTAVTGGALMKNDVVTVAMVQDFAGAKATSFLMVSGTLTVGGGDVATVTWQDTTATSHTATYTTVGADTTTTAVAAKLAAAINAVVGGNVLAVASGAVITVTQKVAGTAGNGKTLTATTNAATVPTLTIHTLGGLNMPGYVENGKTIQLVAVDGTGATVSASFTATSTSATVTTAGLVTADWTFTGVTLITATSGTATGVFAVIVVPVQVITGLAINLVPTKPVSTTKQQLGAIASNAAYSALDYTTQAVWTDMLPVASINATTGLLTYSTDETGNVNAYAGGIAATANVKVTAGVVTLVKVVGPVTRVILLTVGTDIVAVDGKATSVDAAPEIVGGRTFVPIRFIAETFGSKVEWLPETRGITITLGTTTIGLQIGNKTVVINGKITALEAAPYIKNSRTMVPLRVISESFGGDVAWDPALRTITITYVVPVVLPAA